MAEASLVVCLRVGRGEDEDEGEKVQNRDKWQNGVDLRFFIFRVKRCKNSRPYSSSVGSIHFKCFSWV